MQSRRVRLYSLWMRGMRSPWVPMKIVKPIQAQSSWKIVMRSPIRLLAKVNSAEDGKNAGERENEKKRY